MRSTTKSEVAMWGTIIIAAAAGVAMVLFIKHAYVSYLDMRFKICPQCKKPALHHMVAGIVDGEETAGSQQSVSIHVAQCTECGERFRSYGADWVAIDNRQWRRMVGGKQTPATAYERQPMLL